MPKHQYPRYEYDREVNALYICLREIPDGAATRQIELQEGVYLVGVEEGRTLGIEYLDIESLFSEIRIQDAA